MTRLPHRALAFIASPIPAVLLGAALAASGVLAAPMAGATAAGDPVAGNPVAGAAAFKKCASCHQVGPSARSVFGPELNGIHGRRAGAVSGYAYSPAMKKAGIVWNDQMLARFLRDPSGTVPGTKMRFWGIGDERQIANLLAYLRQYPASVNPPNP